MHVSIPDGDTTVVVSIISPNEVLGVPPSLFLTPEIKGTAYSNTPCLCFLVEHKSAAGKVSRLLFDLGIRKDWRSYPPTVVEAIESMGITITTENDIPDLLLQHGIDPASIDYIVFSHGHFDHVGDPSLFPSNVGLVVGPGFQNALLPGFPEDPASTLDSAGFTSRKIIELNFADAHHEIATLPAVDWFGDGSFFLLDTPGHAPGHISALARTTSTRVHGQSEDTFMLLGGDCCHHAGELRPHARCPLPSDSIPTYVDLPHDKHLHPHAYIERHPLRRVDYPFFSPAQGAFNMNAEQMRRTLDEGIARLDGDPRVLVVPSHEHWMLDVVDLFPKPANNWHRNNWAEKAKWRFLQDFT